MNAWRMRASSPSTSLLSTGLIPRMPAMNTKSPARAPRLQVPVGSIAPLGASTETRLALERWSDNGRGIVVAVAREIADRDLRIGNVRFYQALDFDGIHGHRQ